LSRGLGQVQVVTTQEVLTEFLNYVSSHSRIVRERVSTWVADRTTGGECLVIEQSGASFNAGLQLYRARLDKEYSLTDCISMAAMRARNITDVLTHDHHFEQEGFRALLRG